MIPIWSPYDMESGLYVEEYDNKLIFSDTPLSFFKESIDAEIRIYELQEKYSVTSIVPSYQVYDACWYIVDSVTGECFDLLAEEFILRSDQIAIIYIDYASARERLLYLSTALPSMTLSLRAVSIK